MTLNRNNCLLSLLVIPTITTLFFSFSVEAQTQIPKAAINASRTTPAAERIRRDANSIHCKRFPSNHRAINSGRQFLSYCSHLNHGGIKLY
jgi:hypothetical protein